MTEEQIWRMGFKAGEGLDGQKCPYGPGTREAWVWHKGWIEGASKRLGYSHCKEFPKEQFNR